MEGASRPDGRVGGAGCQEDFLEEERLELGLGGQGGFAGEGVEKGIPGRRNSLWVWGPSDSLVVAESSDQTQEGSKRAVRGPGPQSRPGWRGPAPQEMLSLVLDAGPVGGGQGGACRCL